MRLPLSLPLPPERYEQHQQDVMVRELEAADLSNQKKYEDYTIDQDNSLKLKDGGGRLWKIKVDNAGQLYAAAPFTGILDEILDHVTLASTGTVV